MIADYLLAVALLGLYATAWVGVPLLVLVIVGACRGR